jgi:flagellar protein FlaJ
MKKSKPFEKLRALYRRLKARLKLTSTKTFDAKPELPQEKIKISSETPQSLAYHLIGDKTAPFLPLFKDLDLNLQKSGLKVNFKVYVSLTVFATILTSVSVLALIPCLLIFVFNVPVLAAALFGVGGSLFTFALSIFGFYLYPVYRADTYRRALEDELPFTTGFMAILTSAGVSPERIFHSISNLSVPLAASAEAKDIVRDVGLFGSDIISALEKTSKRTPSESFREMIEGFISTIHSGGNLSAYLREKSRQYMKLKKIGLKKYSDTLSMLSEVYVALLLTGPLFLVIMLSVMAMLGGGDLGLLSPDFLLSLLTYMGIPLGATIFLIILDTVSPKW